MLRGGTCDVARGLRLEISLGQECAPEQELRERTGALGFPMFFKCTRKRIKNIIGYFE